MGWTAFAAHSIGLAGTLVISAALHELHEKVKPGASPTVTELQERQDLVNVGIVLILIAWVLLMVNEFRTAKKEHLQGDFNQTVHEHLKKGKRNG